MGSHQPPIDQLTTPLLSSRTLTSAAVAGTGSRLPLRRGSISGSNSGRLVSSTAPRLGGPLRSVDTAHAVVPSTASRIGTLKRTSTTAGLQQDTELSTVKRQLSRALHDLDEERHKSERTSIDHADATHKLQVQLNEAQSRIDRLERHRALLLAKERGESDALASQREEVDAQRAASQDEARRARERLSELEQKYARLGEKEREATHRAAQADIRVKAAEGRVQGLEDALQAERSAVSERSAALVAEQARRRSLEVKVGELEMSKPEPGANTELIREELHRQVSHLKNLEKENGRLVRKVDLLEKSQGNVEMLKEQNKALDRKAKAAEELRRQLATLETDLAAANREKKEWQSFLGTSSASSEFSSPHQLAKALAATRIEAASYLDRVETLKLELGSRDRLVAELENAVVELEAVLESGARDVEAARAREKAAEQGAVLLRQEVTMLKKHLDSYAAEESIHHAGNFDEQKSARLVELEQLLDAHKIEIGHLAQQVAHYRALSEKFGGTTDEIEHKEHEEKSGKTGESLKELLAKNAALEQEISDIIQENETLAQDLEALEAQLGSLDQLKAQGHFDSSTTTCYQLADNPESQFYRTREADLTCLRAENLALIDRIDVLEKRAGVGSIEGLVPRESWETLRAKVAVLEAAVAKKEKMAVRLTESFMSKTEDVRKAVRSLLGYDIALQESNKIRLISLYAPEKDRALVFDPWPGGPMPFKLLTALDDDFGVGGLGSGEVQMNGEVWIAQRRSLPGFLASLTLTLWEEKANQSRQ